jgi:hypothetical protein
MDCEGLFHVSRADHGPLSSMPSALDNGEAVEKEIFDLAHPSDLPLF